jgi:hypothetical protein
MEIKSNYLSLEFKNQHVCEISGSRGGEHENDCFWAVTPYSFTETDGSFTRVQYLHASIIMAVIMETLSTSETSVSF